MSSPEAIIFSVLNRDNIMQLELIFQRLFQQFDSISGRRAFLQLAGIDDYFINGRDFNLPPQQFITILVADLKSYRISLQNPYYHPLLFIIHYVINLPREQSYYLDDRDIECLAIFLKIGKIKIQELKPEFKIEIPHETPTIDILIITALKDELNALKNCDNQSGKSWQELKDSSNYSYYKTTFNHKNGTQLNIVAARPVEMGENYTNNLATRLISELKPRCLAMTGVCAGNKKETFLGDVIVANRVFKFDYGKLVTHYESIGDKQIRTEEIFHDIRTYNLKRQWEFIIQEFPQDWLNTIQTPRPKSDYHQERWLLHKLYDFQQQPDKYSRPDQHPERPTECPDWRKVIQQLREKELLKTDSLELTEKAQKEINNDRLEYLEYQHYKDPLNSQIHTGVIATTSKVQKDPQLFQRIEKLQRKILGVEMEGAAIGAVAEIEEIPIIIIKGVQDYADDDKSDQFRQYAAEVSARFLLAFLTTIELAIFRKKG